MEQKLSHLFDFQRFEQNGKLAGVIADVEGRYVHALSDDDLELVSAAGDSPLPPETDQSGGKLVVLILPQGEKP